MAPNTYSFSQAIKHSQSNLRGGISNLRGGILNLQIFVCDINRQLNSNMGENRI
jgi:hypothetical protein